MEPARFLLKMNKIEGLQFLLLSQLKCQGHIKREINENKKAFETAVVGGIEVKNRMIRSATLEYMGKDGIPDDRLFKMYDELCDGKVGLIITGNIGFSASDHHQDYMVLLDAERSIQKMTELTSAVHAKGTKIVAQINHTSSQILLFPMAMLMAHLTAQTGLPEFRPLHLP